ncbi:hypothetical protein WA158_003119 [Blastocystis sp. Blastoise]
MNSNLKLQIINYSEFKILKKQLLNSINFIFQDESKISVQLSCLKKYPKSLLFLIYENPENYIIDEDSYYIDSLPFSIQNMFLFIENKLILDSLSMNEIFNISDSLKYFLGNETIQYLLKIEDFQTESLKQFIKDNQCEINEDFVFADNKQRELIIYDVFTKERNIQFLEHSLLFNLCNITKVILKFDFSDNIPYESIYPSNLHTIFPKLETYTIQVCYYPTKKEIRVKRSNPYYYRIYKEYKLLYYEENYPQLYNEYINIHIEDWNNHYYKDRIQVVNDKNTWSIMKNKLKQLFQRIDIIDIDEEIRNENENQPDLYIQSLSHYSYKYNKQIVDIQRKNPSLKIESDCISFDFIYVDSNQVRDIAHPILKRPYSECDEIVNYILNLPICKQLKTIEYQQKSFDLLQVEIPPFLKAFQDGIFDTIQILNIYNFLQLDSYPEYIQLVKDIIATHVFPNVTTLQIDHISKTNKDITILKEILSLITRDRFPLLHIYDLCHLQYTGDPSRIQSIMNTLFPISLIQLFDSILFADSKEQLNSPLFDRETIDNLYRINKQHKLNIYINFDVSNYDPLWKQFYDSDIIRINTIYYNFHNIYKMNVDYTNLDLTQCSINHLYLCMNTFQYEVIDKMKNKFININNKILHKVSLEITNFHEINNYEELNRYLNEYFSLFSTINYQNVSSLAIYRNEWFDNHKIINIQSLDINTDTILYNFFSLFSNQLGTLSISCNFFTDYLLNKCMNSNLWKNIQHLSFILSSSTIFNDVFICLSNYIKQNKLLKLASLDIQLYSNSKDPDYEFDLTPIYTFMDSFKESTSLSLPLFKEFTIELCTISTGIQILIPNVFECFPSLSFYLHKPIHSIIMCKSLIQNNEYSHDYYDYIYNQLTQDSVEHLLYLELYTIEYSNHKLMLETYIQNYMPNVELCIIIEKKNE